jgi:hypothetical protein
MNRKYFFFSIKKKDKCLFSRRNGYVGKIIHGYSVCIRIFGFDIFSPKTNTMSNKEKLAEEALSEARTYVDAISPSNRDEDSFKYGYIKGYEAKEEEAIKFAEWCAGNVKPIIINGEFAHWQKDYHKNRHERFTTQQLLDKFRESQ